MRAGGGRRARAHRPPGARKGTTGTASWLGRPAGPLGQARLHSDGLHREVSAGGFSSFLSIFFSVICFDLVLNTKSFYLLLSIFVGTSWIAPKLLTN